jgi:hypothetical protein
MSLLSILAHRAARTQSVVWMYRFPFLLLTLSCALGCAWTVWQRCHFWPPWINDGSPHFLLMYTLWLMCYQEFRSWNGHHASRCQSCQDLPWSSEIRISSYEASALVDINYPLYLFHLNGRCLLSLSWENEDKPRGEPDHTHNQPEATATVVVWWVEEVIARMSLWNLDAGRTLRILLREGRPKLLLLHTRFQERNSTPSHRPCRLRGVK